jgi:histidine triad (HIT) family protein
MSEAECVFCKIVRGEIETDVVRDEEKVLAFNDARGRAPVHVLVIPKHHVANLEEVSALPDGVARRLFEVASEVARERGVGESGYAVRINNGPDAGQEVFHLHLHVLGGERLGMP